MQTKRRDFTIRQRQATTFPPGISLRHTGVIKHKILPSLNKMTNPQMINFQIYEQLKEQRKLQLFRPKREVNLFLEGEVVFTAISTRNHDKTQPKILDMISIPRCKKKTPINIRAIFHDKAGLKIQKSNSEAIKTEEVNFNIGLIKHRSPPPRRIPLYTTIQNKSDVPTIRRQTQKGNKSVSNFSKVKQVNSNNLKVALYLQKKQLDQIKAESFIVMQYPSMNIITGNRYRNNGQIASLTKIMTFYSVMKLSTGNMIDITNTIITVDEQASEMTGTSAELVAGDLLSVQQLLYGLMLPSGNDAALTLAKWAGDILNSFSSDTCPLSAFITLMNKNAKQLGMKQSSFGNPHGLPNFKNTSNPYDLSLLISACLNMPLFRTIVSTKNYNIWIKNEGASKEVIWQNTNKLLRRQGFIGIKTGVTVTAGPCLATCYEQNDKKFIVVLLHTNKLSRRFKQTRMVLGWALKKYNSEIYSEATKKILKNDAILDSDNSQDQQEFKYQKLDATQLAKRNKILVYEL